MISLVLLPLSGNTAVAEDCEDTPLVDVAQLPGVTPAGFPYVELHLVQVRRSTCDYLMLSLKGRAEYVSGAHVLLRDPNGS